MSAQPSWCCFPLLVVVARLLCAVRSVEKCSNVLYCKGVRASQIKAGAHPEKIFSDNSMRKPTVRCISASQSTGADPAVCYLTVLAPGHCNAKILRSESQTQKECSAKKASEDRARSVQADTGPAIRGSRRDVQSGAMGQTENGFGNEKVRIKWN